MPAFWSLYFLGLAATQPQASDFGVGSRFGSLLLDGDGSVVLTRAQTENQGDSESTNVCGSSILNRTWHSMTTLHDD